MSELIPNKLPIVDPRRYMAVEALPFSIKDLLPRSLGLTPEQVEELVKDLPYDEDIPELEDIPYDEDIPELEDSKHIYVVNCEDSNGDETTCTGAFKTHKDAVNLIMTTKISNICKTNFLW